MTAIPIIRKTVGEVLKFEGIGLHSAVPTTMTLFPSEGGIAFRCGSERVMAHPSAVSSTNRSTCLGSISTVEHIMSALAAYEITDVEVELSAAEVPGLDGSSLPFVEALSRKPLSPVGEGEVRIPFKRVFDQIGDASLAAARGTGQWRFELGYAARWPQSMVFETHDVVADYVAEIAPARTFALEEELPHLERLGIGQGLNLDSAVILGRDGFMNAVRFDDEPARHKLLDVIGDLYLAGIPIRLLSVIASKSGHKANVAFAAKLLEAVGG